MDREIMIAKLFFRAAFPVMKVPLADDPAITKAWKDVKATVQISADCEPGPDTDGQSRIGACLHFDNGSLEVVEELPVTTPYRQCRVDFFSFVDDFTARKGEDQVNRAPS